MRSWDFQGRLKENGQQVITNIKTEIEITSEDNPQAKVQKDENTATIQIQIPEPGLTEEESVGRRVIIDGDIKGEIFNDYTDNQATGEYSHVSGYHNVSQYPNQTVLGKYNSNKPNNIVEVGWGSSTYRRNVAELNNEGELTVESAVVKNDITLNNSSLLNTLNSKISTSQINEYLEKAQALIFSEPNLNTLTINEIPIDICTIDFITSEFPTTPIFMITIPFEMDTDGEVVFSYTLNDNLLINDTVRKYCSKGNNIVTLVNPLVDVDTNFSGTLKLKMSTAFVSSDIREQAAKIETIQRQMAGNSGISPVDTTVPTATIRTYGIKSALYVQGIGLSDAWNARLTFGDAFTTIAIKKLNKIIFVPFVEQLCNLSEEAGKNIFIFANEEYWNCDLTKWLNNEEFFKLNKIQIVSAIDNSIQDAIRFTDQPLTLESWKSMEARIATQGMGACLYLGLYGLKLDHFLIKKYLPIFTLTENDIDYNIVFSVDKANDYEYDRLYFDLRNSDTHFYGKDKKYFKLKDKYTCSSIPYPSGNKGVMFVCDINTSFREITLNNFTKKCNTFSKENTFLNNPLQLFTNHSMPISVKKGTAAYIDVFYDRIKNFKVRQKGFKKDICDTIVTDSDFSFHPNYMYITDFDEVKCKNKISSDKTITIEQQECEINNGSRVVLYGTIISIFDISYNNIRDIYTIKCKDIRW